ncbi:hypothetical protein [Kitasatospora sp. NPDC093102]|uniref:hypothetical protein n=1 Tax=Kitasatospora sp. NPDC093102 TaxID=3155069 RepID=UPI00343FD8B9
MPVSSSWTDVLGRLFTFGQSGKEVPDAWAWFMGASAGSSYPLVDPPGLLGGAAALRRSADAVDGQATATWNTAVGLPPGLANTGSGAAMRSALAEAGRSVRGSGELLRQGAAELEAQAAQADYAQWSIKCAMAMSLSMIAQLLWAVAASGGLSALLVPGVVGGTRRTLREIVLDLLAQLRGGFLFGGVQDAGIQALEQGRYRRVFDVTSFAVSAVAGAAGGLGDLVGRALGVRVAGPQLLKDLAGGAVNGAVGGELGAVVSTAWTGGPWDARTFALAAGAGGATGALGGAAQSAARARQVRAPEPAPMSPVVERLPPGTVRTTASAHDLTPIEHAVTFGPLGPEHPEPAGPVHEAATAHSGEATSSTRGEALPLNDPTDHPAPEAERIDEMVTVLTTRHGPAGVHWLLDPATDPTERTGTLDAITHFPRDDRFFVLASHVQRSDGAPSWRGHPVAAAELAQVLTRLRHEGTWDAAKPLQLAACNAGRGLTSSYAAEVLRELRRAEPGRPLTAYAPRSAISYLPKVDGPFSVDRSAPGYTAAAVKVGWDSAGNARVEPDHWVELSMAAGEDTVHTRLLGAHLPSDGSLPPNSTAVPEGYLVAETQSQIATLGPEPDGAREFGAEAGLDALYRDGQYLPNAMEFEQRLGAAAFADDEAAVEVGTAVDTLMRVLVRANPATDLDDIAKVFLGDDPTVPGQIGLGGDRPGRLLLDLIEQGNARELLTAFHNAAYGDSPLSLAHLVDEIVRTQDWGRAERLGLDVAALRRQAAFTTGGHRDRLRTALRAVAGPGAAAFEADILKGGGMIAATPDWERHTTEYVRSVLARRQASAAQRDAATAPRTPRDLDELGVPLSPRELGFLRSKGEAQPWAPLPWTPRSVRFHLDAGSDWVRDRKAAGIPVCSGVSAVAARTMSAHRLIGGAAPELMLKGLFGWLLPTGEHSVYEILAGVRLTGVFGSPPERHYGDGAELYRHIPGLGITELRGYLPNVLHYQELPHERTYLDKIGGRPEDGAFAETDAMTLRFAERRRADFRLVERGFPAPEPHVARWLVEHAMTPRDVLLRLSEAHFTAFAVYTGPSYALINVALKYAGPALGLVLRIEARDLVDAYLWRDKPLPASIEHAPGIAPLLSRPDGAYDAPESALLRKEIYAKLDELLPSIRAEMSLHAHMLQDALRQLPPAFGKVYRGDRAFGGDPLSPVGRLFSTWGGDHYVFHQFASFSGNKEIAKGFAKDYDSNLVSHPVLFELTATGNNGVRIAPFSRLPDEDEVLLKPGSRVRITAREVEDAAKGMVRIVAEEEQPDLPFLTSGDAGVVRARHKELLAVLRQLGGTGPIESSRDLRPLAERIGLPLDPVAPAEATDRAGLRVWHLAGLTAELHGGNRLVNLDRLITVRMAADIARSHLRLGGSEEVTLDHVDRLVGSLYGPDPGNGAREAQRAELLNSIDLMRGAGKPPTMPGLHRTLSASSTAGYTGPGGIPGAHRFGDGEPRHGEHPHDPGRARDEAARLFDALLDARPDSTAEEIARSFLPGGGPAPATEGFLRLIADGDAEELRAAISAALDAEETPPSVRAAFGQPSPPPAGLPGEPAAGAGVPAGPPAVPATTATPPRELIATLPGMSAGERASALDALGDQQRRWLAKQPELVDALYAALPAAEFARTAAQLMVHVDPRTEQPVSARLEARAQVARMLQDRDVAARLLKAGAGVTVIPRDVRMTEVPEFKDVAGMTLESEAGHGRGWDDARGAGGTLEVAVSEENLLGEAPRVGAGVYEDGYSTTTHEFAHTVHRQGLAETDQQLIEAAYQYKIEVDAAARAAGMESPVAWPDGPRRYDHSDNDNYSSRDEFEYFAQVTNAYLGTNHGHDPYTGHPRNNGPEWVRQNEPDLLPLLERLYGPDPQAVHSAPANPVHAVSAENAVFEGFRQLMDPEAERPGPPVDVELGGMRFELVGPAGFGDIDWDNVSDADSDTESAASMPPPPPIRIPGRVPAAEGETTPHPGTLRGLYEDPDYRAAAARFERLLSGYLHSHPEAVRAARGAATRLFDVLKAAYPQAGTEEIVKAFLKDDPRSAGQVGEGLTAEGFSQMLEEGGLREVMTAFFNAAYFKDSPFNLKSLLNRIIEEQDWPLAERLGLNVARLRGHAAFLNGSARSMLHGILLKLLPLEAHEFGRDIFSTGNVLANSRHWLSDSSRHLGSFFSRRRRPLSQGHIGVTLGRRDYEVLGAGLSPREVEFLVKHPMAMGVTGVRQEPVPIEGVQRRNSEAFVDDLVGSPGVVGVLVARGPQGDLTGVTKLVEAPEGAQPRLTEPEPGGLGPDLPLSWLPGRAVYEIKPDSLYYRWVHDRYGMPVIAGESATAAKLMLAFDLIAPGGVEPEHLGLALIGWLGEDHSVYETLRGMDLSGTMPPMPSDLFHDATRMYQGIPGLAVSELRTKAEGGMLPHEAAYLAKATKPQALGGFGEPGPAGLALARERREAFAATLTEPDADPYVQSWLERHGTTAEEVLRDITPAHFVALAVYSGPARPLVDVMLRTPAPLRSSELRAEAEKLLEWAGTRHPGRDLLPEVLRPAAVGTPQGAAARLDDLLPAVMAELSVHAAMVSEALERLPRAFGTAFRAGRLFEDVATSPLSRLSPTSGGSPHTPREFTSATRSASVARRAMARTGTPSLTRQVFTTYELNGRCGVEITPFSARRADEEVVLLPGARFRITSRSRAGGSAHDAVTAVEESPERPAPVPAAERDRPLLDGVYHALGTLGGVVLRRSSDLGVLGRRSGADHTRPPSEHPRDAPSPARAEGQQVAPRQVQEAARADGDLVLPQPDWSAFDEPDSVRTP